MALYTINDNRCPGSITVKQYLEPVKRHRGTSPPFSRHARNRGYPVAPFHFVVTPRLTGALAAILPGARGTGRLDHGRQGYSRWSRQERLTEMPATMRPHP